MLSMCRFAILRPNPVDGSPPVGFALSRRYRLNIEIWSNLSHPGPSSRTRHSILPSLTAETQSHTNLDGGENLTAFDTRLSMTCSRASLSANTRVSPFGNSQCNLMDLRSATLVKRRIVEAVARARETT